MNLMDRIKGILLQPNPNGEKLTLSLATPAISFRTTSQFWLPLRQFALSSARRSSGSEASVSELASGYFAPSSFTY